MSKKEFYKQAVMKLESMNADEAKELFWRLVESYPGLACKVSGIVLAKPVSLKVQYQAAIRELKILSNEDARNRAFLLVSKNPKLFCDLLEITINPIWKEVEAKYPGLKLTKGFIVDIRTAQVGAPSGLSGKIAAIKKIRELTGLGLRESKDFLEQDLDRL
jgi:hypothetical protein